MQKGLKRRELAPCVCGRQPKHYEVRGKDLHMLECAPCNTRTPKFPTFRQAVESSEAGERVALLRGAP